MAATKKTTAVAKTDDKTTAMTAGGYDYGDYSDYQDNAGADDLLIPFLSILQPMSPEILEADEDDKPDALRPGSYHNSVTGELTMAKDGLVIQPVLFQTMVVEWIPRDSGGGIAGRYEMTDPFIREARKKNGNSMVGLKNGDNDLVETVYLYANVLNDDGTEVVGFAVLPVKSTSLQPVKGFRTAMQMVKGKPPYFAFRAKLSSEKKTNDAGTWFRLKVSPLSGTTWTESMINPAEEADLLQAGVALADMVGSGEAKADFKSEEKTGGADERAQSGGRGGGKDEDDEVPF